MNCERALGVAAAVVAVWVLAFQNNNYGFSRGHHGFLSSHGAAIAKNLSPEHGMLMFSAVHMDKAGHLSYDAYNRFPVTSFLLIKGVMAIWTPDMAMEISAARQLMNLFFIGSWILAMLVVYRMSGRPLAAAAAASLAFSSIYLNYYNDMIFNDIPTLFGFLLAMHGGVVYEQTQKRKQLFIKALAGIALGWQVFAILLAYITMCALRDLAKYRSFRHLFKGDYFKLGLASLLFGCLLLAANILVEARMTGKPIPELSTVQSFRNRTGGNEAFSQAMAEQIAWGQFARVQLERVGAMSIPYPVKAKGDFFIAGVIVLVLTVLVSVAHWERWMLIAWVLSGFIWAFPMRNFTVAHDFQSIFYIGIPLAFYSVILRRLDRNAGAVMPVAALLALAFFLQTHVAFDRTKAAAAANVNPITHDFQNIADLIGNGSRVCIDGDVHRIAEGYHAAAYYLAGNYLTARQNAEYIVSRNRQYNDIPLTPENSVVFLFEGTPRSADAFNTRGKRYLKEHRYEKAILDFNRALEESPDHLEALINRGKARKRSGHIIGAISDWQHVLKQDNRNAEVANNLAWIFATSADDRLRDGVKAVKMASRAVDLSDNPLYLDTLAAAYAEAGDFEKARNVQKRAVQLLKDKVPSGVLQQCLAHLKAYKADRPWRDK